MTFENLSELLKEHKYVAFVNELDEMTAQDAAEYLGYVEPEILPKVFRLLKKATAAEIFPELDSELQETIISAITDSELSKLIEELFIDGLTSLPLRTHTSRKLYQLCSPHRCQCS